MNSLRNIWRTFGANHNLLKHSNVSTYPIPRLKENFKFIEKTYSLLNEHIKMNIDIYPAGDWLLDNLYVIEETVQTVIKELTLKKYKNFTGLENNEYNGYARIYVLASEIIAYTEGKINEETLTLAILAYQKRKTLSMEEIWNLWVFLEIAIIENIRNICEKIYLSENQKYKVENIIERLVENKKQKDCRYINKSSKEYSYKEMKYPFIEHMSYKLKQYGKQGLPYLNVLEKQVNKMGVTISEVIRKEHFDIAMR